jgi:phytoene desaturase
MKKHAIIIGSGFGALGSACILGKAGWKVTVLEKNESVGGRATIFKVRRKETTKKPAGLNAARGDGEKHMQTYEEYVDGASEPATKRGVKADEFIFDRGPSWYLMPDVFEHFFSLFDEDINKILDLKKLSPSYQIFYKDLNQKVSIFSDLKKDIPTLEAIEEGSGKQLEKYLDQAGYQYEVAKDRFMYKNYDSVRDFMTREVATEGRKLSVFKNMDKYVRKYFKTEQLQKIMQYPLVFLGSSPYNTPAIYNIMSHIDFNMGVFYPQGGIYKITEALVDVAKKYDVTFKVDSDVSKILVENGKAVGVKVNGKELKGDIVISNADIHHTEQKLLESEQREYSEKYWQKRTMAPSALIMYLGVDKQYDSLTHHNLLFSRDWQKNFAEIFDMPQWPDDPSLYICAPSKTDPSVAPKGYENMFVLVPIASGLDYTEKQLGQYADKILATMEKEMDLPDLRKHIVYQKNFSVKDFTQRYNSYQGTALGLAHTLRQTAIFRPNNISKKVADLYYVGAGTNPGIGMPVTLISAELLYKRIIGDKTSGPLKKI